jgi:hypothetical protein
MILTILTSDLELLGTLNNFGKDRKDRKDGTLQSFWIPSVVYVYVDRGINIIKNDVTCIVSLWKEHFHNR